MAFEPDEDGQMGTKRHKPEDVVAKLRQVDVLVSQGQSVAEAIRAIGVTEVTYYRWRKEYGGLKSDQVRRMKDLEVENQRLRKAIDRPPRGGPSSKLVQGRPLLHGSLGRRSRPSERSRPSGEGRHEHLRGRWSVAERGVRAHAVVV